MHEQESLWLKKNIQVNSSRLDNVLNVGSSNKYFVEVVQPHINRNVIRTLKNLKIKIFNLDLKRDKNVHFTGDILDDTYFKEFQKNKFSSIICSNVLEHVTDPYEFAKRLAILLKPKGLIFVTAPTVYPIHNDPIDNRFRPNIKELEKIFPNTKVISFEYLNVKSIYKTKSFISIIKIFIRAAIPIYKFKGWVTTMYMILWLFKDRYVSCVTLERIK